MLEQIEIAAENFYDDDGTMHMQEQIIQRLDRLFDLVRANDEQIRKCQVMWLTIYPGKGSILCTYLFFLCKN